jgi:hypothetical protein
MTSRTNLLPTVSSFALAASRGRLAARAEAVSSDEQDKADYNGSFEQQIDKMSIITGTPKTVIPKIKHVLEYLRPGNIFFWDGDGAMDHDDAMRSLRLFGEEVIPATREIAKSLDLNGAFEMNTQTNKPMPVEV